MPLVSSRCGRPIAWVFPTRPCFDSHVINKIIILCILRTFCQAECSCPNTAGEQFEYLTVKLTYELTVYLSLALLVSYFALLARYVHKYKAKLQSHGWQQCRGISMEFSICDGLGGTESLFTLLQIYQFPRRVLTTTTTITTGAVKAAWAQLSSTLYYQMGRTKDARWECANGFAITFPFVLHNLPGTSSHKLNSHIYIRMWTMGWWILRILKQDAAVVGTADVGCFVLLSKDGNF